MRALIAITVLFAAQSAAVAQVQTRDMSSTTTAGSTTVDNRAMGVDVNRNTSVGVGVSTIYTRPGQGSSGPQPGTQSGSTSSSSGGVTIERRF